MFTENLSSGIFSKGTIFNEHRANAEWTLASFPSLFSGLYTQGHGFFHPTKNDFVNFDSKLPQDFKKMLDFLEKFAN